MDNSTRQIYKFSYLWLQWPIFYPRFVPLLYLFSLCFFLWTEWQWNRFS